MSHDSRYETECPQHGWYFYEDGCAVAGCENAPPTEAPWAYYKGLTNEAALEAWGEARRAEEANKKVGAALPAEHAPSRCDHCNREMGLFWMCDEKHPMVYRLATVARDALCAHRFDSTVCVSSAGHEGPHITSNAAFPHGLMVGSRPALAGSPADFSELIAAARFALKECEEITSCYPNAGDFWGLADNAAQELRRALAGEQVSAFAKSVCAPPQVDVERLNRAVDTMMEQAKNLREVLGRVSGTQGGTKP